MKYILDWFFFCSNYSRWFSYFLMVCLWLGAFLKIKLSYFLKIYPICGEKKVIIFNFYHINNFKCAFMYKLASYYPCQHGSNFLNINSILTLFWYILQKIIWYMLILDQMIIVMLITEWYEHEILRKYFRMNVVWFEHLYNTTMQK